MPRIRQYAERDAMKDFVGEINAQRARFGYDTYKGFGKEIGVSEKSAWNYLKDPGKIKFDTLRAMVKTLKLNPIVLLKALGYSTQDIRKMAKELEQ